MTGDAQGVAVDANGVMYVSSRPGELLEFAAGRAKPFVTITGLSSPGNLAVDSAGNVFVTGSQTPVPLTLKGVTFPEGVAFDPGGDLFVTDANIEEILAFHAGQTKPFEIIDPGGFVGATVFGTNGVMYVGYVVSGLTQFGAGPAAVFPPAVP